MKAVVASAVLLGALAAGCTSSKRETAGARPLASASAHDVPKKVRLSAQVLADAGVKTARTTREAIAGTIDLPGEIASDPDRTARIASPLAGRIEQVSFQEGSVVKKGDALAQVRVPELGKVRAAHLSTQAKARAARSNAERLQSLRVQGLSSEQELMNAAAEAQALEADAQALGEQLGAMGTSKDGRGALLTLRAPLSGVAVSREAIAGQPIGPEQSIGTIADLSTVWFVGRVFERNLDRLRLGAHVTITLDAFPRQRFEGTLSYLGKQLDPTSRTLTARVRLQNPADDLRIGLYGTAHVLGPDDASGPAPVVVSRSAVVELEGKSVAFVALGNGEFEAREVTLGDGVSDRVAIRSGLAEGEEVVVEGGFTLKSALLRATFAEEE